MQQDRDLSFDAFRGLAMVAVIAAHAFGTVSPRDYSSIGKWNFYFLLAYMQPLLFTVPALFFMSGYWSSKRPMESLRDYGIFLKRKLPRVLIPYLFWSLILLGYTAVKTQKINVPGMVLALLMGRACYPYYFLIALVQLYLITPLLHYINRRRYGLMLVFALTIASLSMVYLSRVYGVIWHLPIYLPFYSWVIYYEIGFLIRANRNKAIGYRNMCFFILPAALVSLLLSEVEAAVLVFKCDNLPFAISPVKYSTFSYSVCVIVIFLLARKRFSYWPEFLITCGRYSFGIYLIHLPVLNQVARFIKQYETVYSFQPLYQVIVAVLTLSACLVIISVARRLVPKVFCVRVLGF
jgi:surface polysaccharide O-acyltransferase-like enzyme